MTQISGDLWLPSPVYKRVSLIHGVPGAHKSRSKKIISFLLTKENFLYLLELFPSNSRGRSLKVILCDPMNGSPINFFENQTSRLTRAVRLVRTTLLESLILAQSERWRHG
jgi:hypothetical protein